MDSKITLSFDEEVIRQAKLYAEAQGISLSRLTEYLLRKITAQPKQYASIEDIPVSSFISQLAESCVEYKTTRKSTTLVKSRNKHETVFRR
jgi:antitoxin component of RelBE/YafQ-DinJ toxin-antitoxin module